MRFFIAMLVAGVTVVTLIAFAAPTNHGLTVHEWGTFTSVQGSDGTLLEGLQNEEEKLPDFVHALAPIVDNLYKGLTTPAIHVTQKMETPVLYFYSQQSQPVRVKVEFNHGLLSQWYPRATAVNPSKEQHPFDISQIKRSSLQWDVLLIPNAVDVADHSIEQPVDKGAPWSYTRQVVSTSAHVAPTPAFPDGEQERFIFYRGLGNFTLPISIHAGRGDQATVHNTGKEELPAAFALEMTAAGSRYTTVGKIGAGATVEFSLGKIKFHDSTDVAAELKTKVQTALMDQGLFEDEAKAMVNTWSRQWFITLGTRLIYLVPRATTDALLPLQITPAPEKIVRVLVGRLEYITPEQEAQVIQALNNFHSNDAALLSAANQTIYRLGRFTEPNVLRALALSKDKTVKQSADELLERLKPAS